MAKILKDVNETIGSQRNCLGDIDTSSLQKLQARTSHYVRISSIAMTGSEWTMWASGIYTAVALNPRSYFLPLFLFDN